MSNEGKIPEKVIYVCTGKSCKKKGGKDISKHLRSRIKEAGLKNVVEIIKTDCSDRCKTAPNICFQPQNLWFPYQSISESDTNFDKYIHPKS